MANSVGSFARQGRRLKSNPSGVIMMAIWAGIGLAIIGGIILAIWRGLGSRVSGTFGNVARGVVALGARGIEEGAASAGTIGAD